MCAGLVCVPEWVPGAGGCPQWVPGVRAWSVCDRSECLECVPGVRALSGECPEWVPRVDAPSVCQFRSPLQFCAPGHAQVMLHIQDRTAREFDSALMTARNSERVRSRTHDSADQLSNCWQRLDVKKAVEELQSSAEPWDITTTVTMALRKCRLGSHLFSSRSGRSARQIPGVGEQRHVCVHVLPSPRGIGLRLGRRNRVGCRADRDVAGEPRPRRGRRCKSQSRLRLHGRLDELRADGVLRDARFRLLPEGQVVRPVPPRLYPRRRR